MRTELTNTKCKSSSILPDTVAHSTVQALAGQDTEPQSALDGCSIGVGVYLCIDIRGRPINGADKQNLFVFVFFKSLYK